MNTMQGAFFFAGALDQNAQAIQQAGCGDVFLALGGQMIQIHEQFGYKLLSDSLDSRFRANDNFYQV